MNVDNDHVQARPPRGRRHTRRCSVTEHTMRKEQLAILRHWEQESPTIPQGRLARVPILENSPNSITEGACQPERKKYEMIHHHHKMGGVASKNVLPQPIMEGDCFHEPAINDGKMIVDFQPRCRTKSIIDDPPRRPTTLGLLKKSNSFRSFLEKSPSLKSVLGTDHLWRSLQAETECPGQTSSHPSGAESMSPSSDK